MTPIYEQARALYGSDEQMAQALFEQVTILRLDLELQRSLRLRAEEKLAGRGQVIKKSTRETKE